MQNSPWKTQNLLLLNISLGKGKFCWKPKPACFYIAVSLNTLCPVPCHQAAGQVQRMLSLFGSNTPLSQFQRMWLVILLSRGKSSLPIVKLSKQNLISWAGISPSINLAAAYQSQATFYLWVLFLFFFFIQYYTCWRKLGYLDVITTYQESRL